MTSRMAYAFCPDCGHQLQYIDEDYEEEKYYFCNVCYAELDMDGFPRKKTHN